MRRISVLLQASAVAILVAPIACTRLPAEWRGAAAPEAFRQSACNDHPIDSAPERLAVLGGAGRVSVDYFDAHFRCEQRVAAYVKVSRARVDVLVEPVEMNPISVAKCDCLYDIHLEVPHVPPGTYDVTLSRRWDNRQSPNEPKQVGSARATVR